jgi:hypothetical protein
MQTRSWKSNGFEMTLPDDVWREIFKHLSPAELLRCMLVSKSWFQLVNSDVIWMFQFSKHRQISPELLKYVSLMNNSNFEIPPMTPRATKTTALTTTPTAATPRARSRSEGNIDDAESIIDNFRANNKNTNINNNKNTNSNNNSNNNNNNHKNNNVKNNYSIGVNDRWCWKLLFKELNQIHNSSAISTTKQDFGFFFKHTQTNNSNCHVIFAGSPITSGTLVFEVYILKRNFAYVCCTCLFVCECACLCVCLFLFLFRLYIFIYFVFRFGVGFSTQRPTPSNFSSMQVDVEYVPWYYGYYQ